MLFCGVLAIVFLCLISRVVITGCLFCFFQAEDGIRDLVRSRGLGDVYKRQMLVEDAAGSRSPVRDASRHFPVFPEFRGASYLQPVSYTHLTLPTSDLV